MDGEVDEIAIAMEIVLEAIGFGEIVKTAQLVITGEGRTDFQTAFGKAPVGVAKLAPKYNVPVLCISGGLGEGYEDVLEQGIDGLMSIVPAPMNLDECIKRGEQLIEKGAVLLGHIIKVGIKIGGG